MHDGRRMAEQRQAAALSRSPAQQAGTAYAAPVATTPAVHAEALVKRYHSRAGRRGGSRGRPHGRGREVFAFLGPNGAGKSTTVRMLTTLLSISSGTARVAGVDVSREPDAARRRIGVALQEAGLDPRQTGRELLVLQGR
ncbi:MAG: ATP-binding cassette domain-containing protein, partial [Actinomycetota bacterium]|nr:ATP-binding cassette domain-containing protein [Actinomycetota bacterium]